MSRPKVMKEIRKTPKDLQNEAATYRFGPFQLDTRTGMASRDGTTVPIGHRSAALLLALLRRENDVVPKEDLMEAGWPGLAVEESNLSVQIATLRRALADGAAGEPMIQTVPRRGYRFIGAVDRHPPAPPRSPVASRASPAEGGPASIAVLPFENLGADQAQPISVTA